MTALRIGELAARANTNAPTIRYYEEIGLLDAPKRATGNQRCYGLADVELLGFIRRCRNLGFSLKQILVFLEVARDERRSCLESRDIVQTRLDALRIQIAEMKMIEATLVARLDGARGCCGGPALACPEMPALTRG